jgi:hypothetical protein
MDLIADRVTLTRVGTGTNHEVVRERGDFLKVQNAYVGSFFGFGSFGCQQPVGRSEILIGGAGLMRRTSCQSRRNLLLRLAYYTEDTCVNRQI